MKILISGGCGYIGSFLIPYLAREAKDKISEIVLYDNLSLNDYSVLYQHQIKDIPVKFVKADILDRRSLLKALEGVDTVIHLAAKITQPYTDVQLNQFDQVNNWGTANLADAIEASPDVKKVIYLSSITVYGTSDKDIDETKKPEPITYYGLSKLKGEKHISRIPSPVKKYLMRSSNVYGYAPAMRIDSVINRFMFEGHFFDQVTKVSNGLQSRAFIHIEKLAHYIKAVLFEDIPEGTYNIAEHNMSINEILDHFHEIFPEMDVITVDQDAKLDRVNMVIPTKLDKYVTLPKKDFLTELKEFKTAFSF
ncbi:NAD(P)-dependent oxidoreductase [bacterium]|nr:NAD(P)-dependent oxidoreductase [bacterium]